MSSWFCFHDKTARSLERLPGVTDCAAATPLWRMTSNTGAHQWVSAGMWRGGGDAFSAQSSGCVPSVWNADKRAAELLSSLALARVQVESLEVQAGWGASRGPAKKKSSVDVRRELRMTTVSHLDTVSTTDPLCPITLMLRFCCRLMTHALQRCGCSVSYIHMSSLSEVLNSLVEAAVVKLLITSHISPNRGSCPDGTPDWICNIFSFKSLSIKSFSLCLFVFYIKVLDSPHFFLTWCAHNSILYWALILKGPYRETTSICWWRSCNEFILMSTRKKIELKKQPKKIKQPAIIN